ncbi:PEP/pyruvate-binding domain-containing protein [Parahaliea mediterranea]|uniref:PEP/pyruvate-binding domain-containing protein n=1 Tax=Parahaliea mediterranea TaxID=651086 RepID=UPI000E2FEA54|nr:PEP/pyruvate-binding domain-containing protein [Parahaliea mediterranea]
MKVAVALRGTWAALRRGLAPVLALALWAPAAPGAGTASPAPEDLASPYPAWIAAMKNAPRGPFTRIRWFCRDGEVLPPGPFACREHGGGYQHGEWTGQVRQLRERGYYIANILAGTDPAAFLDAEPVVDAYAQLLIEKYLINVDDGWILRRARNYRGAIQAEDENAAGRALLTEMVQRSEWIGPRFAALRAGVRLLPHGTPTSAVQRMREQAVVLADRDPGFAELRAKIHGAPDGADAGRVRDYASRLPQAQRAPYLALATLIDEVYRAEPMAGELQRLADNYTAAPWLQALLRDAADALGPDSDAPSRLAASATLLAQLRTHLLRVRSSAVRVELLDLGVALEREFFRAAGDIGPQLAIATRRQRLDWLALAGDAAYGTGLLNTRLHQALHQTVHQTLHQTVHQTVDGQEGDTLSLTAYRDLLRYLGRVPGWGNQALRMQFQSSVATLADIEPRAVHFIPDQLRGSPLLFFSRVLDGLSRDANRLAGVHHRLFGRDIGVGFNALNPGLAQGILHTSVNLDDLTSLRADGIYLLPETVSDLPPVAGILTGGEGNPLSHVQLLARNLGIPNVTVDEALHSELARFDGQRVVLAVSDSGLVELSLWDASWAAIFADSRSTGEVLIEPDLNKLDLSERRFLPLAQLRATDSGRVVGPKAAKLGELRALFPKQVSRGLAIPFGLFFQEVLARPHPGGGGSLFDWMQASYARLGQLPAGSAARNEATERFRAELYDLVVATEPSAAFREALRQACRDTFGENGPGVFVRSDTNVEDLPGFTGAGLNLTLPNVVGFDNLLRSIARVWASPFTARAFAWRQAHMSQPEHVYTSILLLESVASDKSGVMVTQDIDSGRRDVLSVAVNEGLGGAVDGQAAESLRVPLDGGDVRVLATATAPWRRVPDPAGGIRQLPASGADRVLQPAEIAALVDFARVLPARFPAITDERGAPAPADVEFGFVEGELRLFQLRPFLESRRAQGVAYLQGMESRLADAGAIQVDLNQVPRGAEP